MNYDHNLRQIIENRLNQFPVVEKSADKYAAVALLIVEHGRGADLAGLPRYDGWQSDPAIILTRRSAKLSNHAGQWALPGGRLDSDETPLIAAQRETLEEIQLAVTDKHYLGRLDDYVTRSGYVMSPMVFWADNTETMKPNPDEVASIHRIPCSEFLRDDAPILDYDELTDSERTGSANHPVLRMPLGEHWIAAPTAAILYQFREVCLLGNQTRVAHFEQPKFAWR